MKTPHHIALLLLLICSTLFSSCYNPCKKVNCLNEGQCEDGECICALGYEGERCDTLEGDKFVGTYWVTESCNSGIQEYSMNITKDSSRVNYIVFRNLFNTGRKVSASINRVYFTIEDQEFIPGRIEGNGFIKDSLITIYYTFSSGEIEDPCEAVGRKE